MGALFGAHAKTGSSEAAQKSGVTDLEAKLGRQLAIDHYYRPWDQTFPTTREQWDFANGRIPMISWAKTYTDQIAFGFLDSFIRQRADAIATLGQPLLIRWFWEMDGNRNQQYTESPALYIAAWQRIVTIFRQEGATNVGWVWCPDADAFDDGSAQQYYPGDDYVDWVCADGYNWYLKAGDHDTSFKNIFKSFYAWALTTGKPIMVGEYGVLEASAQGKANWVNAARTTLKTDQTGIDAVVYFNSYGYDNHDIYRDWTMDTSADSLNAFALMGADPYFNGRPPAPTPDTVIASTSGPTGTVKAKTASFSFSVSPADPTATFACRVDGAAFSACPSPFTTASLGDGIHTFDVRATNAGGTDPTAARRTWTIDTTGPTLSGLAPAAGTTGVARDAAASAIFNEPVDTATVSGTTVKLTGPGGAAVAATVAYNSSTRTVTVTPSARLAFSTTYTVTVKGGASGVADVLGNRMAADQSWSFTTIPPPPVPNTFLGSGPADPSATGTASFTFSSDQPGAAFQCQLDGAAFTDCLSPLSLSGLADGSHTFAVRAWTIDGGTDADPAVRTWRVDTTPPAVSSTTPAAGATGVALSSAVTASFSEPVDPATINGSTVSLRSDTAAVAATVAYDAATRTVTLTPGAPLL
ncbi:MAG TPA: Ig-like domain-containing protein, partial [Acidimicrobiia bacterium]|nr:Ig-like domain-containing protein [Acidimicrobiia bacterium]